MRTSMRIVFAAAAVALLLVPTAATPQSVSEDFDKSRIITLQGTVEGFVSAGQNAPHFYVMLNIKNERWLIEGKSRAALIESGWTFGEGGLLPTGETVTVTVYRLKPTVDVKQALSGLPPRLQENVETDHVAHGIEITLSSGRKMAFGDR